MAEKTLEKNIEKFNDKLERLTDIKWVVLLGIARGLGFTVGASVVAALLLWVLSQALETVDQVPVLDTIIEHVQRAVEEQG